MKDAEKIQALVDEGVCEDRREAYFFLVDCGELEGDKSLRDLFSEEFLETYPL
jgi:hypothetical protein